MQPRSARTPWNQRAARIPKDKALSMREIQQRLVNLPGWSLAKDGKSIACELDMAGFSEAARLLARVAEAADAADHHPDAHLTGYRKLRLELSTHSAGGLTDKDFLLAAEIDALPKKLREPKGGSA